MASSAKILILRGADEGKVFRLNDELINLGRGDDNEIALAADDLEELQASICRRNGRYAIYTPVADGVQVDGNAIPSEKWVWLPDSAKLTLGTDVMLQFRSLSANESAASPTGSESKSGSESSAESTPTPGSSVAKKLRAKRKSKSGQPGSKSPQAAQRKVARFLTDTEGDHLVRLGDDGKLPELSLAELQGQKKPRKETKEQGSPLIYVAVAVSMVMSLAMLLIDTDPSGATADERSKARREIRRFYGDGGNLRPYQRYLRDAELARAGGDRKAERENYERVLDELNAEDVMTSINGLTGDKRDDQKLRRLIGIMLERNR